ncbi:MAG: hypothetical protein HXY22_12860 [Alphaproteobacteria bacterium]|nr:hypothetical protein [Alphaproteobacteria bacterium]
MAHAIVRRLAGLTFLSVAVLAMSPAIADGPKTGTPDTGAVSSRPDTGTGGGSDTGSTSGSRDTGATSSYPDTGARRGQDTGRKGSETASVPQDAPKESPEALRARIAEQNNVDLPTQTTSLVRDGSPRSSSFADTGTSRSLSDANARSQCLSSCSASAASAQPTNEDARVAAERMCAMDCPN